MSDEVVKQMASTRKNCGIPPSSGDEVVEKKKAFVMM